MKGYLKHWRDKQKEQGLCIDCNKPAVEGKVRCQHHLDLQRLYQERHMRENRLHSKGTSI